MKNKIKVTYIVDVFTTNMAGTENQVIKMINGLDKKLFDIQLICLYSHPWFEKNAGVLQCNTTVINIKYFKQISTYLNLVKLIRHLKQSGPDIVHTFLPVSNIVGVFAAKIAGVESILSSRRDYGEWMSRRYSIATKLANRYTDAIVTNSNEVKQLTEREENIPDKKIHVILNGLDLEKFKPNKPDLLLKKQMDIPADNKVIGIIANFRPMKHHETFIKAAREISLARPDVSFLLLGDGELMHETQELARHLNIIQHCHFLGRQENIARFISLMDMSVNCSKQEGLSNALMECMAAGVPCIVTNSGGNPDLITHNFNGYTFDLDDYKTLARLALELLENHASRERFVQNARGKIEKEMDLNTMLSNYERLYETLFNSKLPSSP